MSSFCTRFVLFVKKKCNTRTFKVLSSSYEIQIQTTELETEERMQTVTLKKKNVVNSLRKNFKKKWYSKNSLNQLRRKIKGNAFKVYHEAP